MKLILSNVIISLLLVLHDVSSSPTDYTRVSGQTGTSLVLRCVDLIAESDIFDNTTTSWTNAEFLLRRIALVETDDGANMNSSSTGGMWNVPETRFTDLSETMNLTLNYHPAINTTFGIDWSAVTYSNLSIPLYSAIATRLIIAYYEDFGGNSVLSTLSDQYSIWTGFFVENSLTVMNVTTFESTINSNPDVCSSKQKDIVFVVESSSSSSTTDFSYIKTFITSVLGHFSISATNTHVGILQYALGQVVQVSLSEGTSFTSVNSTVSGLSPMVNNYAQVGIALDHAKDMFATSVGGRPFADGTSRVIVLITDESSNDNYTTQVAQATADNIGIIGVSIFNSTLTTEIESIAGVGDAYFAFNHSSISLTIPQIQDAICKDSIALAINSSVSGYLYAQEDIKTYTVTLTGATALYLSSELTRTTTYMTAYCSETVKAPTPAIYDFTFTTSYNHTGGAITLYITIYSTSTASAWFNLRIGENAPVITQPVTASTTSSGSTLTQAEIAGIVFCCIILLCAIIIAVAYWYFGPKRKKKTPSSSPTSSKTSLEKTERKIRTDLRVAVANENADSVQSTMKKLKEFDHVTKEDRDLKKASRFLEKHECREELQTAVTKRSIRLLEIALVRAKGTQRFAEELQGEIVRAELLLIELKEPETKSISIDMEPSDQVETPPAEPTPAATPVPSAPPLPNQLLLLQQALASGNVENIREALYQYKFCGLPVDAIEVLSADQIIKEFDEYKSVLLYAIRMNSRDLLQDALSKVKESPDIEKQLDVEVNQAENLYLQLNQRNETIRRIYQLKRSGKNEEAMLMTEEFERQHPGFSVDRMIDIDLIKRDLQTSVTTRDGKLCTTTLKKVDKKGYQQEGEVIVDVEKAEKMMRNREYLEKVRAELINLRPRDMAEIKSYKDPPGGVIGVMTAVLYVLGDNRIESWTQIVAAMSKTGKQSLLRRIKELDSRTIDEEHSRRAREAIAPYDLETVEALSQGLTLFYAFVKGAIEESDLYRAGNH